MQDELNLTVFNPIQALIAEVQQQDALMEPDYTTPEGEKELRAWVRIIKGHRASLEKVRVIAKANALEYGRAVDAKAKELKAPFDKIIDARMKPLDDIENAKRAAAEAIVEAERVAAAKAEADRLADLERREKEAAAKEAELKAAQAKIDAVGNARIQAIREKNIAAEAAENARKEAEAMAVRAEQQRIADELSQRAENELQAKIAADKEAERVADKQHRADVESEAMTAIGRIVGPGGAELSIRILAAIIDGKIPNVTIKY